MTPLSKAQKIRSSTNFRDTVIAGCLMMHKGCRVTESSLSRGNTRILKEVEKTYLTKLNVVVTDSQIVMIK